MDAIKAQIDSMLAAKETPRVVVAVMLKGVNDTISAGTGGHLAGPIAKKMLDKALTVVP